MPGCFCRFNPEQDNVPVFSGGYGVTLSRFASLFNFLIVFSSVANGTVGPPAPIPDPDGADISGNAGHDLLNGLHCPI